jgi:hypothetical protein
MSLMNGRGEQEMPSAPPDTSHLEGISAAGTLVADIKAKIAVMRQLEMDMIGMEAAYKEAKKEFENYKASVVVAAMVNAGVSNIQDEHGNFVRLESKFYCNPNKNDEDRIKISDWLKSVGGEHLFKHEGKVSVEQYPKLQEAGIPFADKIDVNTNSLKSFLKEGLGYTPGSMVRFSLNDIPECIHFVVAQDVVSG